MNSSFKLAVVILAAGASTRMGRPKLLLPWGQRSIIGHLLHQWQRLGACQTVVVLAPAAREIERELDRLHFPLDQRIINPRPDHGMFGSIQCASAWQGWLSASTHWLVALGDQPHLSQSLLASLLEEARKHPTYICQPSYLGRLGHPVILPRLYFVRLASATAATFKEFLLNFQEARHRVEFNEPGLDLDLDTPEDYERARRSFLAEN